MVYFGLLLALLNNEVLIQYGAVSKTSNKTMVTIVGVNPTPSMSFCVYQESMSTFTFTQTLNTATGFYVFMCRLLIILVKFLF